MTTASADVPFKGLLPLVEALAKLRTERPEAHLVVVGRLRQDSPVAAAIERLGLSGAVTFESGVSDDRMVELYAEAVVAVVPSLYEGFSLPAVEAMACGVPLVATTGGALPEVVGEDGVTGLLVPPGDAGALAIAIGQGPRRPELAARLAVAARRRVLERFTWHACAGRRRRATAGRSSATTPTPGARRSGADRPLRAPRARARATGCSISAPGAAATPSRPCAAAPRSPRSTPTSPRSKTCPP